MRSSFPAPRPLSLTRVVTVRVRVGFCASGLACDLIRCRHVFRLLFSRRHQYVLLLILFVRPLMVRLEGAQSGGAVYRSVVIRNISCTAAVVVSYIITTIVTVIALLRQHPNDTTVCVYVVRYGISCVVAFFFWERLNTHKGFSQKQVTISAVAAMV